MTTVFLCISRLIRATCQHHLIVLELVLVTKQCSTNPSRQVAQATKFCTVPPNICMELVHVTLLTQGTSRWRLDFFKVCAPLH